MTWQVCVAPGKKANYLSRTDFSGSHPLRLASGIPVIDD
jgi:hypothetical protein